MLVKSMPLLQTTIIKVDIQANRDIFSVLLEYKYIKLAILNILEYSIKVNSAALLAVRIN